MKADQVFKAFSDPTRLRLLNLLRGGEVCVCDLTEVLHSPQPKISRHLAYLKKAGLVVSRKDGLWMYYRLGDALSNFQKSLLKCLDRCLTTPDLTKDSARLKRLRGKCCLPSDRETRFSAAARCTDC